MAYQKQNFVDGLPLSAAQLNHIEEGIEELEKKIPEQGKPGSDGYTPVRGVDYWTDSDKETIIQEVITALGAPVFGTVDENNNIILTGALADGTYTVKYEDGEGNVIDIGTLDNSGTTIVNLLPQSIESDGTPYNGGQGWKTGYRLNSSGAETILSDSEVTGFMPAKYGDTVYLKNVAFGIGDSATNSTIYVAAYDANFSVIGFANGRALANEEYGTSSHEKDGNGNMTRCILSEGLLGVHKAGNYSDIAYFRISCMSITSDSIITVNQPIA